MWDPSVRVVTTGVRHPTSDQPVLYMAELWPGSMICFRPGGLPRVRRGLPGLPGARGRPREGIPGLPGLRQILIFNWPKLGHVDLSTHFYNIRSFVFRLVVDPEIVMHGPETSFPSPGRGGRGGPPSPIISTYSSMAGQTSTTNPLTIQCGHKKQQQRT